MSTVETTISTAKEITKKIITSQLEAIKGGESVKHSPVYLHSSPGIGKSAITYQATQELGIGFIDIRLGTMEASEVHGTPYLSNQGTGNETMNFSTPDWFPTQKKIDEGILPEYGIIFMDELSNAIMPVQHSAYRVIHDRSITNGETIPEGWLIIAAGNLREDKTGARGVAPALANRFGVHITIRPDIEDFRTYAIQKGISHEIVGFLSSSVESLYKFDPSKNDVAFPTPRSWEQADNLLKIGFDETELPIVLSGCIGKETAYKFMAFRKNYEKLPNMLKVMKGEETFTVPQNDQGVMFALSTSLIEAFAQNYDNTEYVKNLEKILNQLPDDFIIMTYKLLKTQSEDVLRHVVMATRETYSSIAKHIV